MKNLNKTNNDSNNTRTEKSLDAYSNANISTHNLSTEDSKMSNNESNVLEEETNNNLIGEGRDSNISLDSNSLVQEDIALPVDSDSLEIGNEVTAIISSPNTLLTSNAVDDSDDDDNDANEREDFNISEYLDELGDKNNQGYYQCPNCGETKLSVNLKTEKYNCYSCEDTKAIASKISEPARRQRRLDKEESKLCSSPKTDIQRLDEWVVKSGVNGSLALLNIKHSSNQPKAIANLLGWNGYVGTAGWYCLSVCPSTGKLTKRGCFKPDELCQFPPDKDGKPQKPVKYFSFPKSDKPEAIYLQVNISTWKLIASTNGIPFNPATDVNNNRDDLGFWEWGLANDIPICITEGVKKAASLLSNGYVAIALAGVTLGLNKQGSVIPSIANFLDSKDRTVYNVFDADFITNKKVKSSLKTFFLALEKQFPNSNILVCHWDIPKGKGIDDVLVAAKEDSLEALDSLTNSAISVKAWLELSTPADIAKVKEKSFSLIYVDVHQAGFEKALNSLLSLAEGCDCTNHISILARYLGLRSSFLHPTRLERYINDLKTVALSTGLDESEVKDIIDEHYEEGRCESLNFKPKYTDVAQFIADINEGHLQLNVRTMKYIYDGKPTPMSALRCKQAEEYRQLNVISKVDHADLTCVYGDCHEYDPVKVYFDGLPKVDANNLTLLPNLATIFLGNDSVEANKYLRLFCISAVARIYEPGCKVDTALVLQGKQGIGKTTFFEILGGEYYLAPVPGQTQVDELLTYHRAHIVELGEIESTFSQRDVSAMKLMITNRVDTLRVPYGAEHKEYPRRFVLCGTTNKEEFLSDATGSRRYLVVRMLKKLDVTTLEKKVDLVWAEATAAYRAGEKWHLSDAENEHLQNENQQFYVSDPKENTLLDFYEVWAKDYPTAAISADQILTVILGIPSNRGSQMQLADTIKTSKIAVERVTLRREGKVRKLWQIVDAKDTCMLPNATIECMKEKMGRLCRHIDPDVNSDVPY